MRNTCQDILDLLREGGEERGVEEAGGDTADTDALAGQVPRGEVS